MSRRALSLSGHDFNHCVVLRTTETPTCVRPARVAISRTTSYEQGTGGTPAGMRRRRGRCGCAVSPRGRIARSQLMRRTRGRGAGLDDDVAWECSLLLTDTGGATPRPSSRRSADSVAAWDPKRARVAASERGRARHMVRDAPLSPCLRKVSTPSPYTRRGLCGGCRWPSP